MAKPPDLPQKIKTFFGEIEDLPYMDDFKMRMMQQLLGSHFREPNRFIKDVAPNDDWLDHRADAQKYLLGVDYGKAEQRVLASQPSPTGIEDTEEYIRKHTLSAETIISDRDFRLMSPKEAQGYVTKALYNQLQRKLELALTVVEYRDMLRMQTKYTAEVVVMARKDLDKLLQEVADRCAP